VLVREQPPRPWPPFKRVLVAQATQAGGDALIAIALADTLFFSVPLGEARDQVALYLLLTMTPFALIAPVVGPALDRWRDSYRTAIVVASAGRALLALLMAPRTDHLVLFPMAFGVLVLSRTNAVSRAALVPAVLPADRTLLWANGRLAVISVIGGAAAALPGVGIQRLLGAGGTLRVAAIVFVVAAVAAFGLPKPAEGPRKRDLVVHEHRALSPQLIASGAAAAALRACVGFLMFFLAFALRDVGVGRGGFGVVLIAAAVGGVTGALTAPALRLLGRGNVLILVSLGLMGVGALAGIPGFGLARASLVAAVAALAAAAGRLGFDAMIQRDAPERVRGRAFARYETLFQLSWVAGAGLATAIPFAAGTGLRTAAAICFVGIVLGLRGIVGPPDRAR
jgi:hypothetical protein